MTIINYLSKNVSKRVQFIFNAIAPLYKRIDFAHSSHYLNSIAYVNQEIDISGKSILDVGTGAGDWGAMFQLYRPKEICGVDFAYKMIEVAKVKHPEMKFYMGDAENLSQFDDNSFDVVTASFVVHGVKAEHRQKMLAEMKRISKEHVVIHDFIGQTPLIIRFLEFLERSDYRNFKKNIVAELKAHFESVQMHAVKPGTGIYIAK